MKECEVEGGREGKEEEKGAGRKYGKNVPKHRAAAGNAENQSYSFVPGPSGFISPNQKPLINCS